MMARTEANFCSDLLRRNAASRASASISRRPARAMLITRKRNPLAAAAAPVQMVQPSDLTRQQP